MSDAPLELDIVDLDDNTVTLLDGTEIPIEQWEDEDGFLEDEPIDDPVAIIFHHPETDELIRVQLPEDLEVISYH